MAVLYRKYRPTKLADVVGQEAVTNSLSNAIKQHKIGHAYLFIGPRGTGKTSVARIFAHAVNGFDYQIEDNYLDIIEIDAASNTGVDNIRELREKAVIAPTVGKYKVYIIDEVHMLSKSASNALLKTLEEPPEHVIFIMATTDAQKIPITIASRTQKFTFRLADPAVMQAHLRKIADLEKIQITDDALEIIVHRGGGSFRDSLSLLDQIRMLSDGEITADQLYAALGLPQDQSIRALLDAFTKQDIDEIHQILQSLLNTGVKAEVLASEMINQILAHPARAYLPLLEKLPEVQAPFAEAKLLLALLKPLEAPSGQVGVSQPMKSAPAMAKQPKEPEKPQRTTAQPEEIAHSKETVQPKETIQSKGTVQSENAVRSEEAPQPEIVQPETIQPETPQPETAAPVKVTAQAFAWEDFVAAAGEDSTAVHDQLLKVKHDFDGTTLHLFPSQKFTKTFLERPANNQILAKHLNGIALKIHGLNEVTGPEDATISKISAIMGDVQEVKGEMPF